MLPRNNPCLVNRRPPLLKQGNGGFLVVCSIAVVVRLEGAGDFHADVVGLFLREL